MYRECDRAHSFDNAIANALDCCWARAWQYRRFTIRASEGMHMTDWNQISALVLLEPVSSNMPLSSISESSSLAKLGTIARISRSNQFYTSVPSLSSTKGRRTRTRLLRIFRDVHLRTPHRKTLHILLWSLPRSPERHPSDNLPHENRHHDRPLVIHLTQLGIVRTLVLTQ